MIATVRSNAAATSIAPTVWLAVLFAMLTAGGYLLLAAGVLDTGGFQPEPGNQVIVFTAAAWYALGGLLLLLRRRWVWIAGAVFNALVLLMFFSTYAGDTSVLLSSGGLVTKGTQLLLQVVLLAQIVRGR